MGHGGAQISFNATTDLPALEALRLVGELAKTTHYDFSRWGSTHKFIQDRVAKFLNLEAQPTNIVRVIVGNDNEIEYHSFCPYVILMVHGYIFLVELRVLPINGVDVVLCIQWVKELGLIVTYYSQLNEICQGWEICGVQSLCTS